MGDEELNFTEDEAQCWADDPRNQAPKSGPVAALIAVCVLLVMVLLALIAATGSDRSTSDASPVHAGTLFVQ